MGNYHYINSNTKGYVYVLDTDSLEFKLISTEQLSQINGLDNIDNNTLCYKGEKLSIDKSTCTVVFEDNELDNYWVLRANTTKTSKGIFNVTVIKKDLLAGYGGVTIKVCNRSLHNIVDIRKLLGNPYSSETLKKSKLFHRQVFRIDTVTTNYEDYIKRLGANDNTIANKDKEVNKENTNNQHLQESISDLLSREEMLNKKIKQLQSREDAIKLAEKDIADRESNLHIRESEVNEMRLKLTDALCKLDSVNAYTVAEIVLDVKNIVEFGETPKVDRNIYKVLPDYTYELILKSLSAGDVINVPKEYIAGLDCTRLRYLTTNPATQGYSSLEKIKFFEQSKDSIIAIVEYSNKSDSVRMYICREFGLNDIQESDIIYYTSAYENMQKHLIFLEDSL